MELEIIRRLKETAAKLDEELSIRSKEDEQYMDMRSRAELVKFERYVAGFCSAVGSEKWHRDP